METWLSEAAQLLANWQADLTDLARMAFAMLLAAIIGYERESANKPAGIRTHAIIAAASVLFISFADPL